MKTIEIKHRHTGAVLYSTEVADDDACPIRTAVERAAAAGADLAGADLAGAYLAGANLAGANLADAYLAGADLAGAYLAGADLAGADLTDASLARANLADAYLADAYLADARRIPSGVTATDPPTPYVRPTPEGRAARLAQRAKEYRERNPTVPVVEQLDAKILAVITDGRGNLEMSDWHHGDACGTTHCRAGWAIVLAGPEGAALERQHGPEEAGRRIYLASTGRVPHFFASNERALDDLKHCAAEQSTPTRGTEP
jgi:hypothetical protein